MMGFFASIIALAIVPHTSNLDNYQFPKIKGYQKEGEAIAVGGSGNEHAEEKHTFGLAPVWVYVCERERERTWGSFYDGDWWWIDMVVLEIEMGSGYGGLHGRLAFMMKVIMVVFLCFGFEKILI